MTDADKEEPPSLYIHLYFDEDVSVTIADNLRTRGFDVYRLVTRARWASQTTNKCFTLFHCVAQ